MKTATKNQLAVELVPIGRLVAKMAPMIGLEGTPGGTRLIIEVSDARLEGDRLKAHQKGSASGDWATVSTDGQVGTLDVRATFETEDGALIFVHYSGRTDLSKGPGAEPVYAAPVFDTGDPRYAWLNKVQGVAKGRISADLSQIEYEICEVR